MAATADRTYLRVAPSPRLPAPATHAGVLGWLRANLFSSPGNIALTLICIVFIAWAVPPLLRFFVIDAVWSGDRSRRLPGLAGQSGARRLLGLHPRLVVLFRLRLLSGRRTLAGRCFLPGARLRHRLAGLACRAAPRHRRRLFLRCAADPVLCAAKRGAARSGCRTSRPRCGAASSSPSWWRRWASSRPCRSASCWRWGGAPQAPGGEIAVGDLHRIRPRRAADHGLVHGERHAAAVRARPLRAG